MGLNRYAKRRDDNEREIVEALREIGAHVETIDTPVDLLVGYRGQTHLVEVKNPKARGSLTIAQNRFVKAWQGGPVHVVRSVAEALEAIGATDDRGVAVGPRRPS